LNTQNIQNYLTEPAPAPTGHSQAHIYPKNIQPPLHIRVHILNNTAGTNIISIINIGNVWSKGNPGNHPQPAGNKIETEMPIGSCARYIV
jgi:hypothetical protein